MINARSDFLVFTQAFLVSFPRTLKVTLLVISDVLLCLVAVWVAFYLRLDNTPPLLEMAPSGLVAVPLYITIIRVSGLYKEVIRFTDTGILFRFIRTFAVYAIIYSIILLMAKFDGTPRSIGVIQPIIFVILGVANRALISWFLNKKFLFKELKISTMPRAFIYGAGKTGRALEMSLRANDSVTVVGFLDDDVNLHLTTVGGKYIYDPRKLTELIQEKKVSTIFLAMPKLKQLRRNEIISFLIQFPLAVRSVPNTTKFMSGFPSLENELNLNIHDLLGRPPISADPKMLAKNICQRVVLVTGAGGSIGSEICRQIMHQQPSVLLLLDISEYALYQINEEVESIKSAQAVTVLPILCSVCDKSTLDKVFQAWKPQTVFHCAAYKHVSLVEKNPLIAVETNCLGTLTLGKIALQHEVKNFTFISTDKAVRPSNVMGATKRFAELIVTGLAESQEHVTNFSTVRFGNVLGSSGSVIPKFKKQIASGGPVTVTHPEVNRFFMTIPEAAQLVIMASVVSKPGETFVLDMGKPIKIFDLAQRMIRLSGHMVAAYPEQANENTIAIEFIGLDNGEKISEELAVEGQLTPTNFDKILKVDEKPKIAQILSEADNLKAAWSTRDLDDVLNILEKITGFDSKQISKDTAITN